VPIRRPARLEQNRHGVFVLRLVIPLAHRDADGKPRDMRISLRTRDPAQARALSLSLNAQIEQLKLRHPEIDPRLVLLEQLARSDPTTGIDTLHGTTPRQVSSFAIEKYPARAEPTAPEPSAHAKAPSFANSAAPVASTTKASPTPTTPAEGHPSDASATSMSMTSAAEQFVGSRTSLANNRRNTGIEKKTSLSLLERFLRERGIDPERTSVTKLSRALILEFVETYARREGKTAEQPLSARTVVKLIGHLREFFDFATAREWIGTSPMDAVFDRGVQGLKARAGQLKGRRNYRPFSDDDLRRIFDPKTYLRFNSAADEFWLPLLGLFTGARLGELVTLRSSAIRWNSVAGVWVMVLSGKNENSFRHVPLPQALIDLGFLNYVYATRRKLVQPLFPHRPMNPTRTADPSKHASRAFGEYLTKVDLTDPLHVFHSFRHTVISRMHVCGVPVGDAELIVGHAAQDASIRADVARSHASRSGVHLGTYSHPGVYTIDTEPVLARLKRRLDASLTFQLDVPALRKAAAIVLEHTRWVEAPRFTSGLASHWVSGWHTNARARAEREVSRLGEAWEPPDVLDAPEDVERYVDAVERVGRKAA
jgi:integrase